MPKDLSAQQVGLQGRSKATEPKTKVLTGRTTFPMSYHFPNTYRYGHIQPFYYQHTVGDDTIPLFSEHNLSTYTLSSPLKVDVNLNKSYFLVDMKAIYPINWNLMYVNPNKGDDVPENTRLVVRNLIGSCYSRLSKFKAAADFSEDVCLDWLRFVFFLESIFSAGSLLSQFNIHLQDFCVGNLESDLSIGSSTISFDSWFDTQFVPTLTGLYISIDGRTYTVNTDSTDYYYNPEDNTYNVSLRRFIELMRSHQFTVINVSPDISEPVGKLFISNISNYPLNLEIVAAYQLGCAQFFTDSNVDYIYSAELYRDALRSLADPIHNDLFFTYNGLRRQYDILSGRALSLMLDYLGMYEVGAGSMTFVYNYLSMLFSHQNSLRFGDYFVTGRTNPLGIGDVTVNTSGASVSVVDITRKIQLQRFLNSVNNTRQKIGEYARNVLGLSNADDNSYDIPAYLGHKTLPIHGMEIENTGSEQREANSVTTLLKASNNVHAFDIETKRPGIIIGVMSFDVARVYSKTIDRMHFHENRFDDYIPQMQFVGDQQIWRRELDHNSPTDKVFAYSLRYMEYKIRNHYAAGGAVESLKSWFFVSDNKDGNPAPESIDPDYIRSQPSEFDRFYSSLTGYSLGTYFHFIVLNKNYQDITRDMVLSPQPLK